MKATHRDAPPFSGPEKTFELDSIIVSKTDLRGHITYVNDVFVHVSGYTEHQLLGAPHNIIRHPDMPRCIFRLLWETIQRGDEVFAYVLNQASDGVGYWVFAHVTPSLDRDNKCVGYHSNRRVPYPDGLEKVKKLYRALLEVERAQASPRAGTEAGYARLQQLLEAEHKDYAQFVFSLSDQTTLPASVELR